MGSSTSTTAIQAIQIPVTLMSILGVGDEVLWPAQTTVKNDSAYDYIVIGGGSAGSVVSTRLAEDQNNSVLLMEYGDDPPLTALAAGLFVTLSKSDVDYNYTSTYDPYAAGSQGNYTTLTAGKMLGGSDSMNHLIHTRGCPNDFDEWAEITGNNAWAYENFLKYFIKSETLDDAEIIAKYPEYHGTDGPMGISRQPTEKLQLQKYLESFAEANQSIVLDLNSHTTLGYSQSQYMIDNKLRQTPGYSYLKRVKDYSNFYVTKNTRVTRIIFENKVAKAVEAVYGGKTYVFRANKEIILSAGVFNSPQILMLSGVGPKDHLNEMGIDVLSDLPVGNNFTEQVATTLVYKTVPHVPLTGLTNVDLDVTQVPFPVLVGSFALNESQQCPACQAFALLLASDTPYLTLACRDTFWYRQDICDSWQKQVASRDSLYTVLSNVAPKSMGTVRLNSTDPFDNPVIKTGFLTDSEDVETMVKCIKEFIKVGNTTFMKENGAELVGLDLPDLAGETVGTDEFWRTYVKRRAISPYHSTGTCAMGSVVDGYLRLIGFDKIRVIDASVIPVTPKSAPNAAVIALAELGADMIKSGN